MDIGNLNTKRNHGILGVGLLLAVVSIAYSTAVIYKGVDSVASNVILIPQIILGIATLIYAISILSRVFSKGNND